MAAFTNNAVSTSQTVTLAKLDLSTGPHTLEFTGKGQFLTILNGESSASLVVTLDGQNVGNVDVPGQGEVDNSAGKQFTVAAGASLAINLYAFRNFLGNAGNTVDVTITGATAGNSFGTVTV